MSRQYMLKYTISFLFLIATNFLSAQTDSLQVAKKDSLKTPLTSSFRLGLDLSRPVIQLAQKEDLGFEITADIQLKKNWYIATELGFESEPGEEDYIQFHTKGSYTKLGFNYNAYENYKGMHNEVYIGLRYGFSTFQQELISLTALDLNNYFGDYQATPNTTFKGLQAHWAELHFGLKVETFPNLFLSTAVHFKKLIYDKKPANFDNLYIPGFGSVMLSNKGVGFNYTISYRIPLSKL